MAQTEDPPRDRPNNDDEMTQAEADDMASRIIRAKTGGVGSDVDVDKHDDPDSIADRILGGV